jgi:hypothetical protein
LPRPETVADVDTIPDWLKTDVARFDDIEVDTMMLYDVALADAAQLRATEALSSVAPLAGAASCGAMGATMCIVKLQAFDHALVPPAFVAFACQ